MTLVGCNVRGRDSKRNADDRSDADEMSKRLRDGSLDAVFHGAPEMLTLKELVRTMTRGLNRNHNPMLKAAFKGAANAAVSRPGPLRDYDEASLARGVRDELAKVTPARKIAAVALHLWKKGEDFDPKKLTMHRDAVMLATRS